MPREPAPLPEGTRFTDVLEAAQAAWLARDYTLARDLIRGFIDPNSEFCCMRCAATEHEPWRVNTVIGTFYVCPACTSILYADKQFMDTMNSRGEVFMEGPKQRLVQKIAFNGGTRVQVQTSQQSVTVVKR